MRTVAALCRRNLHAYYRDPAMVFLSMLSSAMVWVLYVLFLGHLQVTRLQEDIPYATETQINAFVDSWVFSGILMITAFMTGFTALNIYVDDLVTKRFKEFRAMPIRAAHVVLGYQITSIIVAMIMSMVVLIVGYLIIGFADSTWLKPMAILQVVGITLLMSIAFTAFSLFLGSWAPSHAAANAVGIIIGTILGFFAGTY
ncbi:MAG: ABC transporter permease, partial [Propionibacteriaceae bacterium]|nr:ABC transporter permease [Propionibacteriaceae bacterium]